MFERRVRMCASLHQDSSLFSTDCLHVRTLRVLCYSSICFNKCYCSIALVCLALSISLSLSLSLFSVLLQRVGFSAPRRAACTWGGNGGEAWLRAVTDLSWPASRDSAMTAARSGRYNGCSAKCLAVALFTISNNSAGPGVALIVRARAVTSRHVPHYGSRRGNSDVERTRPLREADAAASVRVCAQ